MKRAMMKIWGFVAVMAVMVSCSNMEADDMMGPNGMEWGPEQGEFVTAFGMAYPESQMIVTDAGLKLNVEQFASSLSWGDVKSGRIMFNYSILEAKAVDRYSVRVNSIYPLVVKDIVVVNDASDSRSLLRDPAMPYQASYSGGYLNINVYYPSTLSPEEQLPDVDLCYDVSASTDDTMMLQLCHKATKGFDGENAKNQSLWFSFRVVPEEVLGRFGGADLFAFGWCWWLNEDDHSEGVSKENVSVMYTDSYEDGGRVKVVGGSL